MSEQIVLFGAGSAGRETLAWLRQQGVEPLCFVDNDWRNRGRFPSNDGIQPEVDGLRVLPPANAQLTYPEATWVVTIYRREAREVREQLREMGVKVAPMGTHLRFCQPMPDIALEHLADMMEDKLSLTFLLDQEIFRKKHNYDKQLLPSDIADIYFPEFIKPHSDEFFVDCGAADGDSIRAFLRWNPSCTHIWAYEPDGENYKKLWDGVEGTKFICLQRAVGDAVGVMGFRGGLKEASHLAPGLPTTVRCTTLDDDLFGANPTFIKMDIEGHELQALWGARRIIKEHKPVLAVCAYHEPDHLWEIPLLIHAIQPNYALRLRRYAEGTRELVWYAVPWERLL